MDCPGLPFEETVLPLRTLRLRRGRGNALVTSTLASAPRFRRDASVLNRAFSGSTNGEASLSKGTSEGFEATDWTSQRKETIISRCPAHAGTPMSDALPKEIPRPKGDDAFEKLILALFREIWQDTGATRHGRSGQEQAGIDVYGEDRFGNGLKASSASTTVLPPRSKTRISWPSFGPRWIRPRASSLPSSASSSPPRPGAASPAGGARI